MINKLKVLVVDDSRIYRSMIEAVLKRERNIEVVGSVWSGSKAIEFVGSNHVDMITLDLEMPEMDGIQTLKKLQEMGAAKRFKHEIGVIMLSAFTREGADTTMKALEYGAFDFITKPEFDSLDKNIESLRKQLTSKIHDFSAKHTSLKRVETLPKRVVVPIPKPATRRTVPTSIKAILIGISTGGPKALLEIMPDLSSSMLNIPIFIVQHMPPTFTQSLARSLNLKCSQHTVVECSHNDIVENDHIYIAPGGKHMVLKKNISGKVMTVTNEDEPEEGCRPSVNVLFRSVVDVFAGNVVAIIMTGMGSDGTKGLVPLKSAGAYTIAQDEESCVVWGMPGSAVAANLVDDVVSLKKIPDAVNSVIRKK